MWQELREELNPKGFELVTVALDATGGVRASTFLERAAPRHPALIDQHHVSARSFGFVNIPSSVWIDEQGTIVRPAETAPRPPGRPVLEGEPLPDGIPERMRGIAEESTKINHDSETYHLALADWVEKGGDSEFALSPEEVARRSRRGGDDAVLGELHFELATHLEQRGQHEAAIPHFRSAQRLVPDNWLFRRQAWSLEPGLNRFWQGPMPDDPGAWPYEGDWLSDVRSEGAENYYRPFRP